MSEASEESQLEGLMPLVNLLNQARDAIGSTAPKSKPHLDIEPPSQLGDFELLAPIGRGGMGIVYEARQKSLDRLVALKVLPKSVLPESMVGSSTEPTSQTNLIQRFHVEARAAARLHHSNIVPVFGFGEDEGFYFFVMQRIYGQSLDHWIETQFADQKSPQDIDGFAKTVARFGMQAASGLAYAHEEGVLHRDVKPANLLIDQDNNVQIADFGVARLDDTDALTKTSDVVGTLRYMAPEQASGQSSPQSDIYSLGVTLYEMATGSPAVDDASVRQALLLQKKPKGPTPLAKCQPGLPLDLRTIIEKAMHPEVNWRYASAGDLADDLQRFLEGRTIRARRMPWWERTGRWVERNRAVTALATLLFVALSSAAIISLESRNNIRVALDKSERAKQAAEVTANIATTALEQVFERFSTDVDSIGMDFHTSDFSAPAVDPKTASLLENLLDSYDDFAAHAPAGVDSTEIGLSRGAARLHVGAIHGQLGDHEAAIEAFETALKELDATSDALLRARVRNQIGVSHQMLGRSDEAKSFHRRAIADLETIVAETPQPAVRFELARSRLLLARRLRPGMGPMSFPPLDGFKQDPLAPRDAESGEREFDRRGGFGGGPGEFNRPGEFDGRRGPGPGGRGPGGRGPGGRGPGGPGQRGLGGPGSGPGTGGPPRNPFGPPPRDPLGLGFDDFRPPRRGGPGRRPRVVRDEETQRQFDTATLELRQLWEDVPDSLPVKLLLSTAVRETLGDALIARHHRRDNEEMMTLVTKLEDDLLFHVTLGELTGDDAAARYELSQLLVDFTVFRELEPREVQHGIDLIERALLHVEYLVDNYPNVPAYENLAIHTSLKAATLYSMRHGPGRPPQEDDIRQSRYFLRQAFQREVRLVENSEDAYGYELWCSLILKRMGDLQMFNEDAAAAARSYARAIRYLPVDAMRSDFDADAKTHDSGENPPEEAEKSVAWRAAELLLMRYGTAIGRADEDAADRAEQLGKRFAADDFEDWETLQSALDGFSAE